MKLFSKTVLGAGVATLTAALALSARAVNLGNLPLWFEASHGQAGNTTQFVAHGRDAEFSITATGAEFSLRQANGQPSTAWMTFVGAGTGLQPAGESALDGKINYLFGNNPAQWQSGVPTFAKVRLDQVYPGINVVYYGNQERLEYDLDLAAGVSPETIAIRFDGAEKLSINSAGELVIQLNGGQIIQHQPVAYQTISGERHTVQAGYKLLNAHTVMFAVGTFDRTLPLVIDPVLGYSTFFGGNYGEKAWSIAIHTADNTNTIFIAGQTFSTVVSNGPPILRFSTSGAFSTNYNGGKASGDAFVAKFDETGTNLIYCTYLGGSADDAAYALAVDPAGHAFVAGTTYSTNFPVKNPAVTGTYNGAVIGGKVDVNVGQFPSDAFVSELSLDGSALVYSTYLGGNSTEAIFGIASDSVGTAFVTGITFSTNFPVTSDAFQKHLMTTNNFYVNGNAFVAKIPEGGNQLSYSTYLGGTNFDVGRAIACNNSGTVFVAGYTTSTNFPRLNGLAGSKYLNGSNNMSASDAFVTAFTNSGTGLGMQYSTFLGSSNNDIATGITADNTGNAYVVGWTTSTNFPNSTNGDFVKLNSYVVTNRSGFVSATNAFLTKITFDGTKASNAFSRVFGGFGLDVANGVALDAATNVFVVGSASSTNFPVTPSSIFGSLKSTNSGLSDVFVTVFKADFSSLLFSGYIGGSRDDLGLGIAVDSTGCPWVTGQTLSTNYPSFNTWSTNSQAAHRFLIGTNDAFLTKIATTNSPILSARPSGGKVQVYWPKIGDVDPTTLGIESINNLRSNNWVVVTNPVPVLTNGNFIYTINPTNPAQFFRFHKY